MWKELLIEIQKKDNSCLVINPPALKEKIDAAEIILEIRFPEELKELLLEVDGDNWFVFSVNRIVENYLSLSSCDYCPNAQGMLFVAGNGCGDYLGYQPVDGECISTDIYMWDHEVDELTIVASDLKDAITKYYNDEI